MLNTFTFRPVRLLAAVLLLASGVLLPHARAAVISDDFSKSVNTNSWSALGYACLTARSSTTTSPTSSIPGCVANPTDAAGSGALRLTPNTTYQRGSIVSNYTFPTNQGLQVTFTTYTYGGDKGGTGKLGADGMSFFLMDGSVGAKLTTSSGTTIDNLGASGGALSYSCSNGNSIYSGLTGAYLGLGMDEYGNFLNTGDNTSTGAPANSNNSWGSGTYQSNRIGLRGAGNVSWYYLNQNYPAMYPSTFSASLQQSAVQATCKTGNLWDYRSSISQSITGASVNNNTMSLTLASTGGYNNGDTITIGGTISATPLARTITNPSVSGKTLTFTGSGGTYSVGQTVTIAGDINETLAGQPISSFSNYNTSGSGSSQVKTFRIYINTGSGGSVSSFSQGGYAYVSGITNTTAYPNNTAYQISSINTTNSYLTVICTACTNSYPANSAVNTGTVIPANSANPISIAGNYTTIAGTTGSTVVVSLQYAGSAIGNTSSTVSLPTPTTTGSFTVANVSSTGFDVSLNYPAGTVTNTSGTVVGNARQTTTAIANYPVIQNNTQLGYFVLPETKPIANEAATTRANATPITYKLMITPAGNLNFLYSYNGGAFQQVLNNFPITASNGALPGSFRFGFSGATGGSTNYHDITCFLAEPVTSASGSSGNSVQSGQFKTSTQVYTASYDSYFWNGSVTAVPISLSSNAASVVFGTATWDGNCVLTGGGCATTGVAVPTAQVTSPPSATDSRQLLTWNGSQGVGLAWSNLTSAQQTILNSSDSLGSYRVNWLRGDRTQEQSGSASGQLRSRGGVLGDVVDSSPTWVGAPSQNYGKDATSMTDKLYGTSVGKVAGVETSHADFITSMATRLNVVYVGGNDGFLHGFRTGRNNADGSYDSTLNTGLEVLGFMPSSVLADTRVVGLTNPTYGHDYFVDAAPGYGDLYYGGAWHTWLVSGVGPGGKEIFALDITNPEDTATTGSTKFLESNAANIVKGDWTSATLTTLGCVNAATNCGDNLGYTYGTPIIRRLHNGAWAFIFGNGFGSKNGKAGIYIGVVAPATTTTPAATAGAVTFYYLDTGVGSATNPNGIAYVSSADLDGDHITDYLYAGDLLGNVWRFDITSSKPVDWAVSTYGQSGATPLFTASSSTATAQPITTEITPAAVTQRGVTRVMLGFGTGQGIPFTTSSAETYASNTQSIYGIWDWDMTAWNAGRTTSAGNVVIPASGTKYVALAQITTSPYRTIARSGLQPFTVTTTAATSSQVATRTAAVSTVCWQGSTNISGCSSSSYTQYGWYTDLPVTGEQLIYSPTFESGALVVNTTIPPGTGAVGQCTPVSTTGWTMAINMGNGGGFPTSVFPDANGSYAGTATMGEQLNLVGKPGIFTVGNTRVIAGSNSSGSNVGTPLNPPVGMSVKRISWEQKR